MNTFITYQISVCSVSYCRSGTERLKYYEVDLVLLPVCSIKALCNYCGRVFGYNSNHHS